MAMKFLESLQYNLISFYSIEMPSKRKMGKKLYRKRTQRGGDSASYGFGSAVSPGAPYAQEVIAKEGCVAATRPGTLLGYSAGSGGLPGLTGFAGGGTRRAKKLSKKSTYKNFSFKKLMNSMKSYFKSKRVRKQRGGRWTADTGAAYATGPNVFVPVTRIGCEGGLVNTSPPGAANPTMAFKQMGGVGGVASPYYSAATAGYGNQPSTWVSSSGTPSLLQTPYDARSLNPACLKTGGGHNNNNANNNMDGGSRRRVHKKKYRKARK
jgi:hypothetical protein